MRSLTLGGVIVRYGARLIEPDVRRGFVCVRDECGGLCIIAETIDVYPNHRHAMRAAHYLARDILRTL